MELQSGFVLAVLVAAVLLMDRLGGQDELGRRLFQVALAAVGAFFVAGVAGLIFGPDVSEGTSVFGGESGDVADEFLATQTAQIGVGALSVIAGLAMMARFTTLPMGIMLGGVLLILSGGVTGTLSLLSFFPTAASDEVQVANVLVLGGALAALMWWGMSQYEPSASDMNDDPGDASQLSRPPGETGVE